MIHHNKTTAQGALKRPEIEYPCTWEYTVIGEDCSLLKDTILSACTSLSVKISYSHSSSKGKYHSLKAELEVPTEEVRLRVYESLKCSPAVKIIL